MLKELFSPLLISLGQVAAVLCYLLYDDDEAFLVRRDRAGLAVGFYVLQSLSQVFVHRFVSDSGWGSLPSLQFLLVTWCLYALFLLLWSRAPWRSCCFVAFVLLLVDACVWPMLISTSRLIWGQNYLYSGSLLVRVPFILLFTLLECALARLARRLLPEIERIELSVPDAVLAVTIVIPYFCFRSLAAQSVDQDNKLVQTLITGCCLVSIITLSAEVGRSSGEREKAREAQMKSILQGQQAMYEQKLRDMDNINRKYHDMKNALLYLQTNGDAEELLKSIAPFEAGITTGNEVIDIILNEKLSLCSAEEIHCIPYLDGHMFDFVKPLDLCTLFGNAMDNAIESCRTIQDPDERNISLHSVRRGETVVLTVRNTFSTAPDLRHGLPTTTKQDAGSHGYGLRNMEYIARQYGGSLTCRVEEEEFVLSILLNENAE